MALKRARNAGEQRAVEHGQERAAAVPRDERYSAYAIAHRARRTAQRRHIPRAQGHGPTTMTSPVSKCSHSVTVLVPLVDTSSMSCSYTGPARSRPAKTPQK